MTIKPLRIILFTLSFGALASIAGCLDNSPGQQSPPHADTSPTPDATVDHKGGSDAATQPDKGTADVPESSDAGPQPDVAVPPQDTTTVPDAPNNCMAASSDCFVNNECCSGICTYDGSSYVQGQCVDPLPDGSFCAANGWCQSGSCVDSVCGGTSCTVTGAVCYGHVSCCSGVCTAGEGGAVAGECVVPAEVGSPCSNDLACKSGSCSDGACAQATCVATGDDCWGGSGCCTGLCTYDSSVSAYVAGTCANKQPDGMACSGPEWCESGACTDGVCGGTACLIQSSECWSTSECCSGNFCSYGFDYMGGACEKLQPIGSYCLVADWCVSGNCVNNQCTVAACQDVGVECFDAEECCTGLCTYDGAYVPGKCVEPCQLGDTCLADNFCVSGNCADGTCAAPTVTFTDIWEKVIVPNDCANGYCHGGGQGLWMGDQNTAYWQLTQNSSGFDACGAYKYVVPYHPEQSILWLRVRPASEDVGDPCFETKMPKGSDGLDPAAAELVKQWILAGAPQ